MIKKTSYTQHDQNVPFLLYQ